MKIKIFVKYFKEGVFKYFKIFHEIFKYFKVIYFIANPYPYLPLSTNAPRTFFWGEGDFTN